MQKLKVGDTLPFVGRLSVIEDGKDITESIDFSTWKVECQYRHPDGSLVYDVASPFLIPGGPILDCSLPSAESSNLRSGVGYRVDIRVLDEKGFVRSTATRVFNLDPAVSETPV